MKNVETMLPKGRVARQKVLENHVRLIDAYASGVDAKNQAYQHVSALASKQGVYEQFFSNLRDMGQENALTFCLVAHDLIARGGGLLESFRVANDSIKREFLAISA